MVWKVEFDAQAAHEIKKLDKSTQKIIFTYIREKILTLNHPKDLGKALQYGYVGLWRYRVDKYRIICTLQENKETILILKIAKRDEVYK